LFRTLTLPEIERIVDLQTEDLRKRLIDRGIRLELSEPARVLVARQGFDPVYGARPLKRYLQHELESKIGRALIADDVHDGARKAGSPWRSKTPRKRRWRWGRDLDAVSLKSKSPAARPGFFFQGM
jgi:hypothetical protein